MTMSANSVFSKYEIVTGEPERVLRTPLITKTLMRTVKVQTDVRVQMKS